MRIDESDGIRVLRLPDDGATISTSEESSDLIGNAWVESADMIAMPVSRLDPEFFRLESRFAGEFLQKMVNYQLKLAVIGDVSAFEAGSSAFRDFVWESNRGNHVWFVRDEDALREKLAARRR
jgi:hypothetical protein